MYERNESRKKTFHKHLSGACDGTDSASFHCHGGRAGREHKACCHGGRYEGRADVRGKRQPGQKRNNWNNGNKRSNGYDRENQDKRKLRCSGREAGGGDQAGRKGFLLYRRGSAPGDRGRRADPENCGEIRRFEANRQGRGVFQDIVLVYEVSEEELASYTGEEKEALSAQVKAWAEALDAALQDTGLQAAYAAATKGEDGSETPESIVISGTPTKDVKVDIEEILANAENPEEPADETSKEAVYVKAAVTAEDAITSGGDDSTGDGTEASPYASISKAYSEVADNGTIYLLSDLDVSAKITFNQQKTVTITSADSSNIKTIYSKYDATQATDPVMKVTSGEIIFKSITIDGSGQKNANNQFLSPCFIYCEANGATATMDEGTTITGFKRTMAHSREAQLF